jgi:hypothetical protein
MPIKRIKRDRQTFISVLLALSLIAFEIYPFLQPGRTNAAVTQAFVRFDRHATGSGVSGTACLNTSTSGTETNVVIVFPIDWTISSTASNWTADTDNLPAGSTVWPGISDNEAAGSVTGTSVVWAGTDLSTGTLYCFHFTGASSTIGSAGNDKRGQLKTQGGSPYVDSVDWATSVVSSGSDQITVTASVAATMTFSLSANSASLGTLTSGSTATSSLITQTVSTNARNGWISWVKSGTDGGSGTGGAGALESATAGSSNDIDSPGSHDGTPEQLGTSGGYVLDVNSGTGSPTIAAEYSTSDADSGGHLSYNLFRQTASATAPANGNTVTLQVKARAAVTQQAASDYTDTLTIVAAGSF